jgi:hypothetical protein
MILTSWLKMLTGFFLDSVAYADDRIEMAEENAIEQDDFTEEGYDQDIGGQVANGDAW